MIDFSKIDDGEINSAFMQAHDEIVSLRGLLAHAEPKAHAYDTIAQIARLTMPQNGGGYAGIDVAWRIKGLLERAKAPAPEEEEAPVATAGKP